MLDVSMTAEIEGCSETITYKKGLGCLLPWRLSIGNYKRSISKRLSIGNYMRSISNRQVP